MTDQHYDLETTKQKFEDFLAEDGNSDRKNDHCYYYEGLGQPGCVVTHFLLWLGIPNVEAILYDKSPSEIGRAVIGRYNNSSTVLGLDKQFYEWGFSVTAAYWLNLVQNAADHAAKIDGLDDPLATEWDDMTWKKAFTTANEEYDPVDAMAHTAASWVPETPNP